MLWPRLGFATTWPDLYILLYLGGRRQGFYHILLNWPWSRPAGRGHDKVYQTEVGQAEVWYTRGVPCRCTLPGYTQYPTHRTSVMHPVAARPH